MKPFSQLPQVKYSITRLGAQSRGGQTYPGGFDQTTPSLALQSGALRDCLNFECSISGGYGRIGGYERKDGRPSPSSANYAIVQLTSFVNVPSVGNAIQQAGSGATGTVALVNNVSGAYYIVVTKVVGTFDETGVVSITAGMVTVGTAQPLSVVVTPLLNAQFRNAAADIYRADIGAVPGIGPVLGVVGMDFNGVDQLYAFRGKTGGTNVEIYKATTSGWTLVPFFKIVEFTAGATAEADAGDTLTQGGVTATIKRVMTRSGTYAGSTAAGAFVITTPSGGNFAAGAATVNGNAVTLAGAQTTIELLSGAQRFEFDKGNFSGQSQTRRIYGCDSVNKGFEFDGEVLAPITTGLPTDAPTHVAVHKNMLFFTYESSVVFSGVGVPFRWTATDGGGEIACGDTINGMRTMPGSQTSATLGVFMRASIGYLYGTDLNDFNFVSTTGTGALPYSAQNLVETFIFDDLGVIRLQTTLNYGNFDTDTLTRNILPFIREKRTLLTATSVNREKGQYRVWFSDGYGLFVTTINRQYLGSGVVKLENPVNCADDVELIGGGAASYFGSTDDNGYVYELDKGTSFDGEAISAYIVLAWDPFNSPRILKRYRAASIEVQGDAYANISFGYTLGYGSTNIGQPATTNYESSFSGGANWDLGAFWDGVFTWDGRALIPTEVDMTGTAENVQVRLGSETDYIAPYTLNSVIYHYTARRGMRN